VLLRHTDAVDAKAGICLGFAGAITAVASASFDGSRIPGIAFAIAAALSCLLVYLSSAVLLLTRSEVDACRIPLRMKSRWNPARLLPRPPIPRRPFNLIQA
jgi:drug/metabolite transporter (DMT)-like permease